MGRADLAMRIRVDKYTNVRAIAVLNNGEHHMVTNFVKAQGGCSAPLAADYKRAMEKLGDMKFKTVGDINEDLAFWRCFESSSQLVGSLEICNDVISEQAGQFLVFNNDVPLPVPSLDRKFGIITFGFGNDRLTVSLPVAA